jgi:hypothetical protein
MASNSKGEWVIGLILGAGLLWFLGTREPDVGGAGAAQASASEVMECKSRIEQKFSGSHKVDVSVLTGKSSDKQGPGGTSRVKLYFEIEDRAGNITRHQGVCQFASGVPPLVVQAR